MSRPTPDPRPPAAGTRPRLPAPWRWLLAPLTALERTRGWRRLLLLGFELLMLGLLLLFAWRATSLIGLPDIGEPFDVAAVARAAAVPPEANAMPVYERAAAALRPTNRPEYRVDDTKVWKESDWGAADPVVRRWVDDNAGALALWLEGSGRPDAALEDPTTRTDSLPTQRLLGDLTEFGRLARLAASRRLAEANDPAGAWALYRGVLRASRHAGRNQGWWGRYRGLELMQMVTAPIESWADDPRVDAALLRRALADVRAVQALSAPASMTLRCDSLSLRNLLDQWGGRLGERPANVAGVPVPSALTRAVMFLSREPERSQRAARLYFARWLAECDKLPAERAGIDPPPGPGSFIEIMRVGPDAPAAVRALDEPTLRAWIASCPLLGGWLGTGLNLPPVSMIQPILDRDRRGLDVLLIHLAEALYTREHGAPPKFLGDLIGPDLPSLPPEYDATEPPENVVLPTGKP